MASAAIDLLIGRLVSAFENEISLVRKALHQVENIKAELEAMKAFLKDSECRGAHGSQLQSNGEVEKIWVSHVRDAANEVEDIINEFTSYSSKQQSRNKFNKILHGPENLKTNWARSLGKSSLFMRDEELVGITFVKEQLIGWFRDFPVATNCRFGGWNGWFSHVHYVQPLTESQAWDLFCMKAFSGTPSELESVARELVQKCEGLPLGIVALGALMSTKSLESEWRNVNNSLSWEFSNNPMLNVVRSILIAKLQ
ncbi:NB-ARC domain containing protein [Parasponia andersonii]|uniref:NB-ARC domain containing protein n=1 Tax=Parasponia andersonii TaxID=3476 RepID=A0A2P5AKX5_PARAD|nr:NB-ARC domain containing protein [Parasponia andersonii]